MRAFGCTDSADSALQSSRAEVEERGERGAGERSKKRPHYTRAIILTTYICAFPECRVHQNARSRGIARIYYTTYVERLQRPPTPCMSKRRQKRMQDSRDDVEDCAHAGLRRLLTYADVCRMLTLCRHAGLHRVVLSRLTKTGLAPHKRS
eukprot:30116_3